MDANLGRISLKVGKSKLDVSTVAEGWRRPVVIGAQELELLQHVFFFNNISTIMALE